MSQKIIILGGGESGVGAALLAKQKGFEVFVSDMGSLKPEFKAELVQAAIEFEEGTHTMDRILQASEVIKSPGIPDNVPVIKACLEKGIGVISEIEFAGRYSTSKKICITGSNGKTTTTLLIYHILKDAGLDVGLGGNIGTSFARQLANGDDKEWFVLEISSFQLDGMYDFKAEVAVLLNITPDHLDRYGYQMQNYVDSKFRIVQNQGADDVFVYCSDDEVISAELVKRGIVSKKIPFGFNQKVDDGAYAEKDKFNVVLNHDLMSVYFQELALQGRHNVYNSMAASIVAKVAQIKDEVLRQCLSNFKGVEHRLEKVLSVRAIEFINDSKATNVNSTWYALECMNKPVVWIVGGVDKGNDYEPLFDLARDKVKAIICLGKDNAKLIENFTGKVPLVFEAFSMNEAVTKAYNVGDKGDVVLLSPACASFDLFKNYEDRGRQFKECIRNL